MASGKGDALQDAARILAMSRTSASGSTAQLPSSPAATSGILTDAGVCNGLVAVLRILKIVDRASGHCLFTTQWKWHPHAHAEGVDALVQSFAQFAREIDGGDVVRIHFDSNTGRSNSVSSGSSTSIGNGNGSVTPTQSKPTEDDRRPSSLGEMSGASSALEMLSHQSGQIQAVLFHDRVSEATTQALRAFVERIVSRFLELYHNDLTRLQPTKAAHQAALTAEEAAELVAPFASFSDVLQNELLLTL